MSQVISAALGVLLALMAKSAISEPHADAMQMQPGFPEDRLSTTPVNSNSVSPEPAFLDPQLFSELNQEPLSVASEFPPEFNLSSNPLNDDFIVVAPLELPVMPLARPLNVPKYRNPDLEAQLEESARLALLKKEAELEDEKLRLLEEEARVAAEIEEGRMLEHEGAVQDFIDDCLEREFFWFVDQWPIERRLSVPYYILRDVLFSGSIDANGILVELDVEIRKSVDQMHLDSFQLLIDMVQNAIYACDPFPMSNDEYNFVLMISNMRF